MQEYNISAFHISFAYRKDLIVKLLHYSGRRVQTEVFRQERLNRSGKNEKVVWSCVR